MIFKPAKHICFAACFSLKKQEKTLEFSEEK